MLRDSALYKCTIDIDINSIEQSDQLIGPTSEAKDNSRQLH